MVVNKKELLMEKPCPMPCQSKDRRSLNGRLRVNKKQSLFCCPLHLVLKVLLAFVT